MISLGLLTFLLSNASWVPVIISVLVLGAYAAFLPLMIRGVRASVAGAKAALRAGAPVRVNIERPARPAAPSGVAVAGMAVILAGHPGSQTGRRTSPPPPGCRNRMASAASIRRFPQRRGSEVPISIRSQSQSARAHITKRL